MDAWKNAFFLQEKPMSIKFLVLGGGIWGFFLGGKADFIFMGARNFLIEVGEAWAPIPNQLRRWPHFPTRQVNEWLPKATTFSAYGRELQQLSMPKLWGLQGNIVAFVVSQAHQLKQNYVSMIQLCNIETVSSTLSEFRRPGVDRMAGKGFIT